MSRKAIILVGCVASGKSTCSAQLEKRGFKVFSADKIREEIYGSMEIQGDFKEVFGMLFSRLENTLLFEDTDVVIDNTNVRARDRRQLFDWIIIHEKHIIETWLFDVPLEVCKERNRKRDRKVPEEVIDKFHHRLECNRQVLLKEATYVITEKGLTEQELDYMLKEED